jgi:two-component system response regulator AtoC
LSENEEIQPAEIVVDSDDPLSVVESDILTLRDYDLKIIKATLLKNNNDIRLTAEKLDIGISTIYRILKEEKESE